MDKTMSGRHRPLHLAALAATLALAACGGGKDDEAGQPWMQPTAAPSAAETASAPRTTLAEYAAERTNLVVVQGFPSPTEEELASIHRRSVERGIAQLLPQLNAAYLTDIGNGLALPSLRSSLVNTVAAAARGDTLAQLRQHQPEESGFYARVVQTQGVQRSLWAPAGTLLDGAFLRATDMIEPLPPLASWQGTEVTRRDDAGLNASLEGFSAEALGALELGGNTRLLVVDRLNEQAAFAGAPRTLPDGVFLGADGVRRVMPMLQLPSVRHVRPGYEAHLAVGSGHRHIVTIQPTTQGLQAFAASGELATALSELAQMARQRTLVALPAGTMVLPVVKELGASGNARPGSGLDLASSEVNANLRGLDGGGTFLRTAELATRLSIGDGGLSMQGGHAAAFNFSPLNVYGPTYGSDFTWFNPEWTFQIRGESAPACPRAANDLRSLFIAVFDDDLRLVSLAGLGKLPGQQCQ
jgi:hypothetical protein